ncbi:acyl-CoA dehydrogenase family protein [uncultured Jatrophihabitans sp.]|uniref:acyl-CoA dehydrogenase family protein n=1 Tax=uncultured Jatrophihabitans sp. TaxID=1610747 RepID=UPI0035CC0F44
MDFDLDDRRRALLELVDAAVADSGRDRAFDVSAVNGADTALDATVSAAMLAEPGLDLLDRVLVADRLAELGTATTVGTTLAAAAASDAALPGGSVTVLGPTGLARFGATAAHAVVTDGGQVRLVDLERAVVEPVRSGFGYPYARLDVTGARTVAELDSSRWHEAVVAVRTAEVAGVAAAAVARTAEHLRTRVQFGKPLSALQALRHRFSEAAVSTEAVRWLVREAAWTRAPRALALAAQYAHQTAAALTVDLVQLGGARSFAREFGMHVHTMRLEALRLELGPPHLLARAVNGAGQRAEAAHGH